MCCAPGGGRGVSRSDGWEGSASECVCGVEGEVGGWVFESVKNLLCQKHNQNPNNSNQYLLRIISAGTLVFVALPR
jgi:hypothetical protein